MRLSLWIAFLRLFQERYAAWNCARWSSRRSKVGRQHLATHQQVAVAHLAEFPVQIILVQIKPVFAGDSVPDRVTGVCMQHHLGIAYRAGGEIDQAGVIAASFGARKLW